MYFVLQAKSQHRTSGIPTTLGEIKEALEVKHPTIEIKTIRAVKPDGKTVEEGESGVVPVMSRLEIRL